MKVSLGMNLQSGPWGGGNQFGRTLVDYLLSKNVDVSFDLKSSDLDLVLLAEPRKNLTISAFTDREIFQYISRVNPRAIVVHRVNECDERKGTNGVNQRLIRANLCSDHTVFISTWLKGLLLRQGMTPKSYSVILNGSDGTVFNANGYQSWDRRSPLKLVTHHWGGNWMKGFDIYRMIDEMLANPYWKKRIAFTYIGNLPSHFRFYNARYILPMDTDSLAVELGRHHVYLTASSNEPAGMHHIEGAMSGLPLLYRHSGALPEYCNGFGVGFDEDDFASALELMLSEYDHYRERMVEYPNTADPMCAQYYDLFLSLLDRREEIVKQRKWWRRPLWMLKCVSPRMTGPALLRF